jgi:uncharacterized protein involved in outer membrane biogenesis
VPLLGLAVLLALYFVIGLNVFRDDIAAEIEAHTGRRVMLAGNLQLAISVNPTLVVEDVAFANANWGSRPDMLRIGRMEVQVALLPLLSGELAVWRVKLTNVALLLETDTAGRGNWVLGDASSTGKTSSAALPVIDELSLKDLQLVWRNGAGSDPMTFDVESLTLSGIGSEDAILVVATAGEGAASSLPIHAFRLRVEPTEAGYRVSDIDARIGASNLGGELEFAQEDERHRLTGWLSSRLLSLADLASIDDRTDTEAVTAKRPGRVFSATPFGAKIPPSLQAEVAFRVQQLTGSALVFQKVSTKILADRGVLTVDDFEAQLNGGKVTGGFVINTARERTHVRLQLTGRDVHFGQLLKAASGRQWLDAQGDLDIRLAGSGRSMAELMSDLTGTTRLLLGQGHTNLREVDVLIGGVTTALGTLVDKNSDRARLNCVASSFDVDNGIATSRLLLADTAHSTVYGEGRIDLRSERLKLLLTPKPKSISLTVAVPVHIGGTLAAPTFAPETFNTAKRGAGILAAAGFIAFPPAALLGLGELGSGDDNPCLELATEHKPRRVNAKKQKPSKNKSLFQRAANKVEGTLDGIGGAIKGLFD